MINTILADSTNWIQGLCIGLFLYNFFSYFVIKDKSFLYYSLYLLALVVFLIPSTNNNFSTIINKQYGFFLNTFKWFNEVIYVLIYTLFTLTFFEFKKVNNKLYKNIITYTKTTLVISILIFSIDYFVYNGSYFYIYNLFIFLPSALLLGIVLSVEIYKLKTILSNIYLVGLVCFIILSLCGMYFTHFPYTDFMIKFGIDRKHFLYSGIFIEVIFLSIALGHKNIGYKISKELSNKKLIKELKNHQELIERENYKLEQLINHQKEKVKKTVEKSEKYKLIEAEMKHQNEINELKLSSLLNQMNPHFLFNALNSIKLFIIDNDAKKATYYLNKFSKLIRQILNASKQKEVSLQEELNTLTLYVNLENIRFANEINYQISVAENINAEHIKIPSLSLQPFLENAIWHGLSTKQGDKKIDIAISAYKNSHYQIDIKDNGIGRIASENIKKQRTVKRKSVGINITKERFKKFTQNFNHEFSLQYIDLFDETKKPAGTIVRLKIPLC